MAFDSPGAADRAAGTYASTPRAPGWLADRAGLRPTIAVAVAILAVVLGGIGLDRVVPEPSVGRVSIGAGASIEGAPGWQRVDTGSSTGLLLQRADVRLLAQAQPFSGQAKELLRTVEQSLQSEIAQISFGREQASQIGAYKTATVTFVAVDPSSGGTMEGELICLIAGPDGVLFEAAAPQGNLDSVAGDVTAMAASVRVSS